MYEGEKVLLDLNRDYIRSIAIANEDADLEFYNFRSSYDEFVRKGTLSLAGKKDSYVYEIVDDKLYDVEFNYNEKEKTLEITTDELGHYVVSDIELESKEVKPSKPSKPSTENNNGSSSNTDKNNPDTGASDFVGSAAAMAVTSVAAAGALALKRKK